MSDARAPRSPRLVGARRFGARAAGAAAWRLTRLSRRLAPPPATAVSRNGPTLVGDRDVEWAWTLGHLRAERGRVLDLGAGHGLVALAAASRGHDVVAVDLEPETFRFVDPRIAYRQGDLNRMEFEPASFDQVLNCSTIEHFGLAGRYGNANEPDADLTAMRRLRGLLKPDATMVLTLPVGSDAVVAPLHRIYGRERLPRLLEGFRAVEEEYRAKPAGERWELVGRDEALSEEGSATYYALGLFVLAPA